MKLWAGKNTRRHWWQLVPMSKGEAAERLHFAREVAAGRISLEEAHQALDDLEAKYGVPTKRRRFVVGSEGALVPAE